MLSKRSSKLNQAISRGATIAIVVVIIIVIIGGSLAAYYLTLKSTSTTTTTSPTSSSTTTSATSISSTTLTSSTPTTSTSTSGSSSQTTTTTTTSTSSSTTVAKPFTWETVNTPQYLDPQVSYFEYDYNVLQNVYEPLLWYNGNDSTRTIPWLASNYTIASNGMSANFTLRQGITFADGEPFNATAVYFSLNRLLIDDGSSPVSQSSQAAWIVQQMLNTSLSAFFDGASHPYNSTWVNEVLAQNFVQITGPYTFTINILHPNALNYLLAGQWADIVAPNYTMNQDIAVWSRAGTGYTAISALNTSQPWISESNGVFSGQFATYFDDWASTCLNGVTPKGCGTTYYDGSYQGSLGGTGPYVITSVGQTTNDIVMTAKTNYWGGPYQSMTTGAEYPFTNGLKLVPNVPTVNFNYVPSYTTRLIDLKSGASSGQALTVDIPGTNVYDVMDKNAWLSSTAVSPTITGVSGFGPYYGLVTFFNPFGTNITDPNTSKLYPYQFFADSRWRFALADAVNMTDIDLTINNNLGQVANQIASPGLPPPGAYNASFKQLYSYDLAAAQGNISAACTSPITKFTDFKGHSLSGIDNTCSPSSTENIPIYSATGDTVDGTLMTLTAQNINTILGSLGYNNIKVVATQIPSGQLLTLAFSGECFYYNFGWLADYPWVVDYTAAMFAASGAYPSVDHMNYTVLNNYETQIAADTASNNATGVAQVAQAMEAYSASECLYFLTFYPRNIYFQTSNFQETPSAAFYYNAAESGLYFGAASIT
jgi:ABC-type transport system substrate-binding protein